MSVKKILYATNFNAQDLTTSLIENTLAMRQVGLEEVVFLQVAPFEGWIQALSEYNIKYKTLVEQKLFSSRILSVATKESVSVIVLNLDRKTRKAVRNSLIKNIIKRSSIPILIINDNGHGQEATRKELFENVVIAMDWSPAAGNALTHLFIFEKMLGSLEVVNVINDKLTIKDIRELRENLAKTRKGCLDRGIDAESHVYAGKTSEEIITAAKDYRASLIVLGINSNMNIFKNLFKQSSSYKIAEKANIPVLVVPW